MPDSIIAQLVARDRFELARPLARQAQLAADFLVAPLLVVLEAVAQRDDPALALGEPWIGLPFELGVSTVAIEFMSRPFV